MIRQLFKDSTCATGSGHCDETAVSLCNTTPAITQRFDSRRACLLHFLFNYSCMDLTEDEHCIYTGTEQMFIHKTV